MSAYTYDNYKTLLRDTLTQKKAKVSSRFTYERLASACGIQKTYLSRVLNSEEAHLSEDQLHSACDFLGFSREERLFTQLLRSHDKSQHAARRQELLAEIRENRAKHRRSESHLEAERLTPAIDVSSYHLDPRVMLVHIFLAVERFRANPRSICPHLGISEDMLTSILSKLERMGFIALGKSGYRLTKQSTHLSVESPLYAPFRFMQRFSAMERMQKLPPDRTYNFTAVFSASESVREFIHSRFLTLLQEIEKAASTSKDEEVYQLSFDLFDWSK